MQGVQGDPGPAGAAGPPGPVGPQGPKGNMAQGTPVKGSACAKGDSSYDIDHSSSPLMGSIYLCDDVALKWLRMPQFSLTPW
jgi:hypothetical protein